MAGDGLFAAVFGGIGRWMARNRDMQMVNELAGNELADLGLSRGDLQTIAGGGEATQRRMAAMAARQELPEEAVFGERWRAVDMARRCATCADLKACKAYLADPDSDDDYHRFCPNAAEFDELKIAEGRKKVCCDA